MNLELFARERVSITIWWRWSCYSKV